MESSEDDKDELVQLLLLESIPSLNLEPETQLVTVDDPTLTISLLWERAVQEAVINTSPGQISSST